MSNEILFTIKPKFISELHIIKLMILGGLLTMAAPLCLLCSGQAEAVINALGEHKFSVLLGLYVIIAIVVSVPIGFFNSLNISKNNDNFLYNIYADKIEFIWNYGAVKNRRSTVNFQNIKNIKLTQGFFQRFFGLHTIKLEVSKSDEYFYDNIENIEDGEALYKKLAEIINK